MTKKSPIKKKKNQSEKSEQDIVQETAKELFAAIGIEGEFTIAKVDDGFEMVLETEQSGIVIGYRGEVLESLQIVLSLCCAKKLERLVRVAIEVDDYKKSRTDWLESLAQKAKEQAVEEQRGISIPSLRSWERRIVHLFLQDDADVVSESVGQGRERVLVVKPRLSS